MQDEEIIAAIEAATDRIKDHVFRTPLYHSRPLSAMNGGKVYLKLENEQITGSFKARGAMNKVLGMSAEAKSAGLITASTGNHALGFANALSVSGDEGEIYLPETAAKSKVEALRSYPVTLRFHGVGSLETELHAKQTAETQGKVWISPYNDYDIIAGQGTIGVEILEQAEPVHAVLGCIGGGGMMSGVSVWCKHASSQTKVVGCLPEKSPEMYYSVQKGEVVVMDYQETLSDGSAGGLEEDSITFDLCRRHVDDYILTSEEEIADAIRYIAEHHHKIIEGAAGVAVASFIKDPQRFAGQTVVIIVCGANITHDKFKALL